MSDIEALPTAASRSVAMRRAFDESFVRPAADTIEASADFLAVRIGGDPYALRLSDIAGLHVDLKVVPIPSPAQHLLGIAALRGAMVPIYALGGLLNYPRAATARWILIVKAPQLVGLALEAVESHVRVRDSSLGAVQAAGALRPILRIPELIKSLRERTHDG